MDRPGTTSRAGLLRRHLPLGKSQLQTMALRALGVIGARAVNLVHVAQEPGKVSVDPAPNSGRLQQVFPASCGCPATGPRR